MAYAPSDPLMMMRRLHQDMDGGWRLMATRGFPPGNVWQGADSVAVTAELPGVEPGEIDFKSRRTC